MKWGGWVGRLGEVRRIWKVGWSGEVEWLG